MRAAWGWLGAMAWLASSCGPSGLATQAVVSDVGRGPLLVLVGADAGTARQWLDAATPGYRLVQVTAADDLAGFIAAGPWVLVVPARDQALGLELAAQDAPSVAGILIVADGTPVSPAWQRAVTDNGWKWRLVGPVTEQKPLRSWWQDWLPARQAAFTVQPSALPQRPPPSYR
jgi:hypothetical protein